MTQRAGAGGTGQPSNRLIWIIGKGFALVKGFGNICRAIAFILGELYAHAESVVKYRIMPVKEIAETEFMERDGAPPWDGCYPVATAARLTGAPPAAFYALQSRGIIHRDATAYSLFAFSDRPSRIGYGLTDLMIVKLLRGRRNKRLNPETLAQALRQLFREHGGVNNPAWQQAPLYVQGRRVYAQKPAAEVAAAGGAAGRLWTLPARELFDPEALHLVPTPFRDYVEINPEVSGGEPVLRHRFCIMTSLLAAIHERGKSCAEIAKSYAPIPQKTIEKAIEYEHWLDRAA